MARAGMALRRGGNQRNTDSAGDDVQRSIELLDRVLSEFDDVENANQVQNIQQLATSTSPAQQARPAPFAHTAAHPAAPGSPSPGHQSEDDGYMSMNGRKQRLALPFTPLPEHREPAAPAAPCAVAVAVRPGHPDDFPPPPEEARRLIATLLPKVSPTHRPRPTGVGGRAPQRAFPLTQLPARAEAIPPPRRFQNDGVANVNVNVNAGAVNGLPPDPIHTATQTTLPKTKHQRPYGWESNDFPLNPPLPPPGYRYGSLPYQHAAYPITSPTRVPPRTVPTASERHREVKRHGSEDNLSSDLDEPTASQRPLSEMADDERFSDDSLEDVPPPPPPPPAQGGQRASIAWEVPLDEDALLTPGSTKVINRRRRKSGSYSSTSSIPNRLKEFDDWPDPPPCTTEDEVTSPFSDSDEHMMLPPELNNADLSGNSTYIIRKGKTDRRVALHTLAGSLTSTSSLNSRLSSELSLPAGRLSRDLHTPHSRYSVDLSTPHSRLDSPRSRLSLDLNLSSSPPSRLSAELSSSRSSTAGGSSAGEGGKRRSGVFEAIGGGELGAPEGQPQEAAQSPGSPAAGVASLPDSVESEEYPRRQLGVTVEEEEEADSSQPSAEMSPLRRIEQSISELLERRDIEVVQDDRFVLNGVEGLSMERRERRRPPAKPDREPGQRGDLQKSSSHSEIQKSEEYYRQLLMEGGMPFPKRNGIQKSESAKEMLIAHRDCRPPPPLPTSTSADFASAQTQREREFPPLPPSPVAEDDDEYAEVAHPALRAARRAGTLPIGGGGGPPAVPPHHRAGGSDGLRTRSMDVGYSRGRRSSSSNSCAFLTSSARAAPSERRALPSNDQPPRRAFQQRSASSQLRRSPLDEDRPPMPPHPPQLQTSCSLPETPIFARGSGDAPRTPHRRAPEAPTGGRPAPRQSSTLGNLNTIATSNASTYRHHAQSAQQPAAAQLERALAGVELLRLAGGPQRGWYPKQRRRPASIEHLDRAGAARRAGWAAEGGGAGGAGRQPLTLPPNLTPRFFQRSPRDALRRVTSLLIKKGNNGKESKKDKEMVSPTIHENANGEEVHKKKGFFKSFWKRSRHYSLEQQQ